MSIIDPLSCGFAKVKVFEIFTSKTLLEKLDGEPDKHFKSRVLREKFEDYSKFFHKYEEKFQVEYSTFANYFSAIVEHIRSIGKTSSKIRDEILAIFSSKVWASMPQPKQNCHSLYDCDGCLKNEKLKYMLAEFPIKKGNVRFKARAKSAGLVKAQVLRNITSNIVNKLNEDYKRDYNTTFTGQICKQHKNNSPDEVKSIARATKQDIEKQWKETAVERYTCSFY